MFFFGRQFFGQNSNRAKEDFRSRQYDFCGIIVHLIVGGYVSHYLAFPASLFFLFHNFLWRCRNFDEACRLRGAGSLTQRKQRGGGAESARAEVRGYKCPTIFNPHCSSIGNISRIDTGNWRLTACTFAH